MPRRALRCVVDLQLNAVTAPGVWLPSKEDVYVSVSLFNQYRNTRLLTSIFPVLVHEKFIFEKTYYTACDPSQVAEFLEDELIIFELIQLSEYTDGAVRLASYSTNARDFLYPYPTLAPSYSSHDREILMCRTIAFPGISPKLEFSSKTVIKESVSPELDALDDALTQERASRSPRRTPRLTRSRSLSPTRSSKLMEVDPRPPFVVRKTDEDLIGRTPRATTTTTAKRRSRSPYRSPTRAATDSSIGLSYSTSKPSYRLSEVIREPYEEPLPVFKPRYTSKYDDDKIDDEVNEVDTYISPRPRSVSPVLTRSSLGYRYGYPYYSTYYPYTSTYTSTYYPYYSRLTDLELERARARRLGYYYPYYSTVDDLDLELRLARIRAGIY